MASTRSLFAVALAISAPALASELVPAEPFRSIELRGGGEVIMVPGAAQRVTIVEGSSAFTQMRVDHYGKLQIDACNARCPRNYYLVVRIESPRVPDAAISGGGKITAAGGFARQADLAVAISGGGQIDVRSVSVSNARAAVDGGGEIKLNSSNLLTAAVSGGGLVRYSGNPRVMTAINGGGSVVRSN